MKNELIVSPEEIVSFKIMSTKNPPGIEDNEGFCIAFVPLEGYQSSKYYRGTKTWKSLITQELIFPSHWLKLNIK